MPVCQVCRAGMRPRSTYTCPECSTPIHTGCACWIGGCSTFGCANAGSEDKRWTTYVHATCAYVCRARRFEVAGALVLGAFQLAYAHYLGAAVLLACTLFSAASYVLARHLQESLLVDPAPVVASSEFRSWMSRFRPSSFLAPKSSARAVLVAVYGPFLAFASLALPISAAFQHENEVLVILLTVFWYGSRRTFRVYHFQQQEIDHYAQLWEDEIETAISELQAGKGRSDPKKVPGDLPRALNSQPCGKLEPAQRSGSRDSKGPAAESGADHAER
jgi:hypothetical protein